jgi:iron-sulfur cluster repair protein YtfE (RIC family)
MSENATSPSTPERVEALGEQLVEVHRWFRQELASVRAEVDAYLSGGAAATPAPGTPPDLGAELRRHCLTFCADLHGHHTGEDSLLFPLVEEERPDLAAVLGRLRREHQTVARIITDLEAVLADVEIAQPADVRARLEALSAELEAHLDYEEAQLVEALNALPQRRVDELMAAAAAAQHDEES